MNKKNTGSYYTPSYLASFISKRVLSHFEGRTRLSVLEPSVGDGSFVEELDKSKEVNISLTALDINKEELDKASNKWNKKKIDFKQNDFLEYSCSRKYSIVIGNPPYVKKNRLTKKQIELSEAIHEGENLSKASAKNIWTSFLVKANTLLTSKGVLAFVLPAELLQVKFAEEIREYLKLEFERIEIFTFNDLMFECKGQDTIVLFAYKKSNDKGEFFSNISSKEVLENSRFILKNNEILVSSKVKWTHHFLSSEDLVFIENLKNQLKNIGFYANSKPGIVTAANKFFIINSETEERYKLSNYTKPIVQKSLFVNGSVVFDDSDIEWLESKSYPSKLLQLDDSDKISIGLREYLKIGVNDDIPSRYKCKLRNKWYVIPNISEKPDAFFFKRSHLYPKLLKNNSSALVTDSAYKVEMKNGFDLNSFIYSFYNSLTLLLSEIEGRYYGGGVLELIPSEFKKLPLPYKFIDENEFEEFARQFENKDTIESLLVQNDFKILNHSLNIRSEEIGKIVELRKKLRIKRLRK